MAYFGGALHLARTEGVMQGPGRPELAPTHGGCALMRGAVKLPVMRWFEKVNVSILVSADPIDHGLQCFRLSRLHEVILESGLHRLAPIGLLPPPG